MADKNPVTPEQLKQDDGERIAKALKHAKIPVGQIAQYLEVHRNTVGAWIRGRQSPHPAMLKLIAQQTGVPELWLRTGKWPDTPGEDLTQVNHDG